MQKKQNNDEFTLLAKGDQIADAGKVIEEIEYVEEDVEPEIVSDREGREMLVSPTPQDRFYSPNSLLALAIREKSPVEALERLVALQREHKADMAKEAFDEAMAKFQSECPIIKKTKAGAQKAYYYAPIESIVEQVKVPLKEEGFSYSIQQEFQGDMVKVFVKVRHKAGHSEVTEMTVPLGAKTGLMSNSQVVAAATTFATRYAFKNAFGIMTGDDDTDAAPMAKIAPQAPIESLDDAFAEELPFNAPQGNYRASSAILECHGVGKNGCPDGATINQAEYSYSKMKYGKQLCRNCQQIANQK